MSQIPFWQYSLKPTELPFFAKKIFLPKICHKNIFWKYFCQKYFKKNIIAKKNFLKNILKKSSKIYTKKYSLWKIIWFEKKYCCCAKNIHSLFTSCEPSFGFPWPSQHPLRPLSQVSLQALWHHTGQLLTNVEATVIDNRMEIHPSIVKAEGSQGAQLIQYKLRSDCLIEIGYN